MITKEELAGSWNDIKGLVKEEWGNISDDELKQVEGNFDRLVGLIQKKSGQARNEIERTLQSLAEHSSGLLNRASQAVHDARQSVQDYATQAGDMAREQFGRAQTVVRRHPSESILMSFGTGLLMGIVVGLMVRSK